MGQNDTFCLVAASTIVLCRNEHGKIKMLIKIAVAAFLISLMAGCTTTQEIRRPDGKVDYVIACGASLGWDICYHKANQVCPEGYTTKSQDAGFNRKELFISCPSATHK